MIMSAPGKVLCKHMVGFPGVLSQTKKVRYENVYICSEWEDRNNG